ncbi:hypothetical protein LTR62_004812 [Meristemomyces frigidus]|uniref:Uncharacterized protein n=1 Tax=Meristemomyces frigidus TaxID=1508187 RepID=A0AAN7TFK0_9PEZI|nr:hypothetical protein LTR62_004812 [Meristemomyces frigidus]
MVDGRHSTRSAVKEGKASIVSKADADAATSPPRPKSSRPRQPAKSRAVSGVVKRKKQSRKPSAAIKKARSVSQAIKSANNVPASANPVSTSSLEEATTANDNDGVPTPLSQEDIHDMDDASSPKSSTVQPTDESAPFVRQLGRKVRGSHHPYDMDEANRHRLLIIEELKALQADGPSYTSLTNGQSHFQPQQRMSPWGYQPPREVDNMAASLSSPVRGASQLPGNPTMEHASLFLKSRQPSNNSRHPPTTTESQGVLIQPHSTEDQFQPISKLPPGHDSLPYSLIYPVDEPVRNDSTSSSSSSENATPRFHSTKPVFEPRTASKHEPSSAEINGLFQPDWKPSESDQRTNEHTSSGHDCQAVTEINPLDLEPFQDSNIPVLPSNGHAAPRPGLKSTNTTASPAIEQPPQHTHAQSFPIPPRQASSLTLDLEPLRPQDAESMTAQRDFATDDQTLEPTISRQESACTDPEIASLFEEGDGAEFMDEEDGQESRRQFPPLTATPPYDSTGLFPGDDEDEEDRFDQPEEEEEDAVPFSPVTTTRHKPSTFSSLSPRAAPTSALALARPGLSSPRTRPYPNTEPGDDLDEGEEEEEGVVDGDVEPETDFAEGEEGFTDEGAREGGEEAGRAAPQTPSISRTECAIELSKEEEHRTFGSLVARTGILGEEDLEDYDDGDGDEDGDA